MKSGILDLMELRCMDMTKSGLLGHILATDHIGESLSTQWKVNIMTLIRWRREKRQSSISSMKISSHLHLIIKVLCTTRLQCTVIFTLLTKHIMAMITICGNMTIICQHSQFLSITKNILKCITKSLTMKYQYIMKYQYTMKCLLITKLLQNITFLYIQLRYTMRLSMQLP